MWECEGGEKKKKSVKVGSFGVMLPFKKSSLVPAC